MHECPECGQMCDCDGEDHVQLAPPECECALEDYENEGNDEDGELEIHGDDCSCVDTLGMEEM